MTSVQADPKATSTGLFALACVLLTAAMAGLLVPVLYPPPSAASLRATGKRAARAEEKKAEDAKIVANAAKISVVARTWSEEPSAMAGKIVTLTATLANQRGVKWIRLQPPAKATVGENLEQYPFLLVVEGPFPAVAALERDLEAPANRLAVDSFQASSAGAETDQVSASIGLVAHRVPTEADDTNVGKGKTNAKRP